MVSSSVSGTQLVLAGASTVGRGTPWGTLCEIVRKALDPLGVECTIETRSFGPENGRYVADGRADVGAWYLTFLSDAYQGSGIFEAEEPRKNLRAIAHINHPNWLAVAARAELGLSDLEEVVARRLPVRVRHGFAGAGGEIALLFDYLGWTPESLGAFGGAMQRALEFHPSDIPPPIVEPDLVPWVASGDYDLIVDVFYPGYVPENPHWNQSTILHDLSFLPLPEGAIAKISAAGKGIPGVLPHRILRGVWTDVPTVARFAEVIYCRDDLPDALVFEIARALDENRQYFRDSHFAFSYDPANVAVDRDVPLHPGARSYYESVAIPVLG